jgi:hypothetical protein
MRRVPGAFVDLASSSLTVLPDGSVVFGALDNYNFSRGHLFHFDATGKFLNAFDFGWDSTPAAYAHNGTFSLVIKDNHYDSSAYCSGTNPVCTPRQAGPYYITQLDANLSIEWQFQNTTMDAMHPNGFEWCINMPAVDMSGNVFVNSEDGNIYALPQGHSGIFMTPTGQTFLNLALGAAYTPLWSGRMEGCTRRTTGISLWWGIRTTRGKRRFRSSMPDSAAKALLWLFVLFLGIAYGAGIYEKRIAVPRWFSSSQGSGPHWNADAARADDTGRRFWVFVTTVPPTLLTFGNLILVWRSQDPLRGWWLTASVLALGDRIFTFVYFIPTMLRLMRAEDSPESVATARQWAHLNYVRLTIALAAWLAALKAFSELYRHQV